MRVIVSRLVTVLDADVGRQRRPGISPVTSARSTRSERKREGATMADAIGARSSGAALSGGNRIVDSARSVASSAKDSDGDESAFDLMHTERGFASFEAWFKRIVAAGPSIGNGVAHCAPRQDMNFVWPVAYCPPDALHEHAFMELVRAFADCSDSEVWDLFDLLDHDFQSFLGFPEVYVAMCLLSAIGCRQLAKFFYFHNRRLFGMLTKGCRLSAAPAHVSWPRLVVLLRLIGASGPLISRLSAEFGLEPLAQLPFEQYQEVAFAVAAQLDRQSGHGDSTVINENENERMGQVRSRTCTML